MGLLLHKSWLHIPKATVRTWLSNNSAGEGRTWAVFGGPKKRSRPRRGERRAIPFVGGENTKSHRIHGNVTFTYMKGWFLWFSCSKYYHTWHGILWVWNHHLLVEKTTKLLAFFYDKTTTQRKRKNLHLLRSWTEQKHDPANLSVVQAGKRLKEAWWMPLNEQLVGGWTNPCKKYDREIGNLPQIGVKSPKIFELPPPRQWFTLWSTNIAWLEYPHLQ